MYLSLTARKLLRDVAQRLRREVIVQKARGKAVNEVITWLGEQHIDPGPRLTHAWLRFDRQLLAQIEAALGLSGEAPLEINLSGLSSSEQARFGNREEKGSRESPREHRVLINLPAVPRSGVASRHRDFLDLDWRDIDIGAFNVLIQVENLDSFYAFEDRFYAFEPMVLVLDSDTRALVIYRGDSHYGGAFAKLAAAWRVSAKPHFYFGDFDALGIHNAFSSRATHLLLPPLGWLAQRASGGQLAPEQQEYQASLRKRLATLPEDHPLADYLKFLLSEQRGLLQQWFDCNLTLVPLGGRPSVTLFQG